MLKNATEIQENLFQNTLTIVQPEYSDNLGYDLWPDTIQTLCIHLGIAHR